MLMDAARSAKLFQDGFVKEEHLIMLTIVTKFVEMVLTGGITNAMMEILLTGMDVIPLVK